MTGPDSGSDSGSDSTPDAGPRVRPVGSGDFAEQVLMSPVPVLVDYWAPWCAPCRQMEPVVAGLARELGGRARVVSVDVQAHPGEARSAGVSSVPTYIAFVGGREAGRIVGARPKAELKALLAGHL